MKLTSLSPTISLLALTALASLTFSTVQAAEGWTEDFEAAKKLAAEEKKDLLMDFTGSDWCTYCIKLQKEVLSKPEFIATVPKSFVLVELDYPQEKAQDEKIKAQNEKLQKEYSIDGYPTVLLADASGRVYAKTGYMPGGAAPYLAQIEEFQALRVKRDASFTKAAAAEGLAKATALHEGLKVLDPEIVDRYYSKEIDEIIKLDTEDTLGHKKGQEVGKASAELMATLEALHGEHKFKEFSETIDEFIAKWKLGGVEKQRVLMNKFGIYDQRDLDKADKLADEVIALDATSEIAKQATSIKEQIVQMRAAAGKPDADPAKETAPADEAPATEEEVK